MVSDGDMSGERGGIRHNDVASHDAIVSYMAVGHEKALIPNDSYAVSPCCPAIQSDKFSKDIVASDFQMCDLALGFEILRIGSDRAVAEKTAPFPNICPTVNINMGIQDAAGSYLCIRTDNTVGADMGFR